VWLGGTFGGAIDPAFSQSSMEIDYVSISIKVSIYLKVKKVGCFTGLLINNKIRDT
jgi:hypothetical protein